MKSVIYLAASLLMFGITSCAATSSRSSGRKIANGTALSIWLASNNLAEPSEVRRN
jgi:hypothetical protein